MINSLYVIHSVGIDKKGLNICQVVFRDLIIDIALTPD